VRFFQLCKVAIFIYLCIYLKIQVIFLGSKNFPANENRLQLINFFYKKNNHNKKHVNKRSNTY
jgi:hypothetical protein